MGIGEVEVKDGVSFFIFIFQDTYLLYLLFIYLPGLESGAINHKKSFFDEPHSLLQVNIY